MRRSVAVIEEVPDAHLEFVKEFTIPISTSGVSMPYLAARPYFGPIEDAIRVAVGERPDQDFVVTLSYKSKP